MNEYQCTNRETGKPYAFPKTQKQHPVKNAPKEVEIGPKHNNPVRQVIKN
jgi:hypothetical protein